jgi:exosortase D (VPLPA-CTERM-specific)
MTFTMFPLPSFLYNKVTLQLKLISSKLGVDMMQLFGMSAFREGNVIDLGFTQLQVVDACSGLRFAIPLLILSLLMAYLYRAPLWKRAILVISSIPLAIVTNALRIALTGLFYEIWGQEVAEGFFHTFSGWVIFISSIVVLLLEILILSLIPPRGSRRVNKIEAGKGREENHLREEHEITTRPETTFNKALWSHIKSTQFVVIIILLGFTLVLSRGINYREQIPMARSFVDFPLEIGQWKGSRQILEQIIIEELDFTDYVMIDYRKADRKEINFYVAYYETQSKGASIHSPASCLPGSGWSFDEDGVISISMPEMHEGSMTVSRAYMTKGDAQQLVYYWFPQRDRILTNLYQLKIYAFWDALTRQRTDGSLVRLITPIYKKENIKGAEERLKAFIREILPVLNEYLPSAEL